MTIRRTITVACDAEMDEVCYTYDSVMEFPYSTITETRRAMALQGWKRRQGKDVCPACPAPTTSDRREGDRDDA